MSSLIAELRAAEALATAEGDARAAAGGQNGGASHAKWSYSRATKYREIRESLEEGKPIAFTGYRKVILLFGLNRMPESFVRTFVEKATTGCSHANDALRLLDREKCSIRKNAKETAWCITVGTGETCRVLARESKALPSVNTTNGAGAEHWVTLANKSLLSDMIRRGAEKGIRLADWVHEAEKSF